MDDTSIIKLYWERDENAVRETAAKYGKLCIKLSENILNNKSDAEECVNDSYLTVWNRIPDERPDYFSAFLCRIVKNLSLKRLEHNTAQKRNPEMLVSLDELQECLPSDNLPEKSFDARLLGKSISDFLRKQKEVDRCIFIRRYWYSDSVKAIAEDLGVKEDRISVTLFRMRKKLKIHLEKEGFCL
ncbi:MAG: sigma-70 family RNA polymerase sigma factor [Clostridia bacterium]|nr:sigma-70 family RNA polymerase sigma factor [Clostridia bacterium]